MDDGATALLQLGDRPISSCFFGKYPTELEDAQVVPKCSVQGRSVGKEHQTVLHFFASSGVEGNDDLIERFWMFFSMDYGLFYFFFLKEFSDVGDDWE